MKHIIATIALLFLGSASNFDSTARAEIGIISHVEANKLI